MPSVSEMNKELSIWEHLAELIRRLRISIFSVLIITAIVAFFPANITEVLENPILFRPLVSLILERARETLLPSNVQLIAGTFGGPIMAYLYVSLIVGLLISSPIIGYELFAFISPALYRSEKKMLLRFIVPFVSLFAFGVAYGYFFIAPLTFRALSYLAGTWTPAEMMVTLDDFIGMTLGMLVITGFFFTIPLFFVIAVQVGLIGTDFVTKRRKYIYGGLLILLVFLTADPTVVSDFLLFVPFLALMEGAIIVARRYERARLIR